MLENWDAPFVLVNILRRRQAQRGYSGAFSVVAVYGCLIQLWGLISTTALNKVLAAIMFWNSRNKKPKEIRQQD